MRGAASGFLACLPMIVVPSAAQVPAEGLRLHLDASRIDQDALGPGNSLSRWAGVVPGLGVKLVHVEPTVSAFLAEEAPTGFGGPWR